MNTYRAIVSEIEYQDTKMMYIGIPFMTLFVVHVGMEDRLGNLLSNSLYYENLIVSLAIAYLTFFSIRSCILGFDQWIPWQDGQSNAWRWSLQLLTSAIVTSFWLIVNDFYDYIMLGEADLLDPVLLTVDWPVSLLLMTGLNYYYYVQFVQARQYSNPSSSPVMLEQDSSRVLIKVPGGYEQAHQEDVRLIFLQNELSCIVDKENKRKWSALSLSALEKKLRLQSSQYFRLNRKLLVHKTAIKGYRKISGYRLELELYYGVSVQAIVSKNKAASFKSWWHQSSLPS